MKILSMKSLAAVLLLSACTAAHADPITTITFEGQAGLSYTAVTPGLGGLSYQNFAVLDTKNNNAFYGLSESGVEVMYDSDGQTSSFSSATALTLYSFYINSTNNRQGVTVTGYDFNGNLIDSTSLSVQYDAETLITLNWTGLASVTFAPNQNNGYFSIDNLTVSEAPATPEPSSLALLGTGILGVMGATRRKFMA